MFKSLQAFLPEYLRRPPPSMEEREQLARIDDLRAQLRSVDSQIESAKVLAYNDKVDDAHRSLGLAIDELSTLATGLWAPPPPSTDETAGTRPESPAAPGIGDDLRSALRVADAFQNSAARGQVLLHLVGVVEMAREAAEDHIKRLRRESRSPAQKAYSRRVWRLGLTSGILVVLILAGIGYGVHQIRTRKANATRRTMETLASILGQEKQQTHTLLKDLAKSGCTACICRKNAPMADIKGCVEGQLSALNALLARAGKAKGSVRLTDAWGHPIALDENEHEFSPKDCRHDVLTSAGPDGILGNDDDIVVNVPQLLCR